MKKFFLLAAVLLVLVSSVYAIDGCCELSVDGAYCQYIDNAQCAADASFVPTFCEQTAFCKIGCCFTAEEGRCYRNTPKARCAAEGATWDADPFCGTSQCQKGCCVLGDQAAFVTEVQCKHLSEQYPEIEMQFTSEVGSEAECIASVKSMDEGCCVTEDGCLFTTRGACPTASTEPLAANMTTELGFFNDMLCSNDKLSCGCSKQFDTGCVAEDVYWFDSCGNRENIYDSNKDRSYNNGYVLSESESCYASKANDATCGNCDYAQGLLCSEDVGKVMPVGEYTCGGVNCKTTFKDDISPNADGRRKRNGESWCVYDSMPGLGRDRVGSRHYRHICINAEEIVEPCKDFREEMCIQGSSGQETLKTVEALRGKFSEADYVESACRDNMWEDCEQCNLIGQDIVEENDEITQTILEERQACCANQYVRDCMWLPVTFGDVEGEEGMCVPQVPPGLKFWADEGTVSTEEAAGTEAEQVCSQATKECTVTYEQEGAARLGTFGKILGYLFPPFKEAKGWHAIKNKHCTTREWLVAGSIACKAQGDCGAYYNVLGKLTFDGYSNNLVDEGGFGVNVDKLRASDISKWEQEVLQDKKPSTWDDSTTWAWLLGSVSAATGAIWGGAAGSKKGEGFWGSALKGAIPFMGLISGLGKDKQMGEMFSFVTGISDKLLGSALGNKGKLPGEIKIGDTITQTKMMNMVGKDKWVEAVDKCEYAEVFETKLELEEPKKPTEKEEERPEPDWEKLEKITEYTEKELEERYGESAKEEDLITGDVVADLSGITGYAAAETKTRPAARDCAFDHFREELNTKGKGKYHVNKKGDVKTGTVGKVGTAINTYLWLATAYHTLNTLFTEEKKRTYKAECKPWQPPVGGEDCEECNQEMKPCSEYKCRSLGAACKLVNEGTSEEKCVAMDVNDVNSPIIAPLPDTILPYTYQEETLKGHPGFTLNEEIKPFKRVELGISTNEPAQCKYDVVPGKKYDEKPHLFGTSMYLYNQSVSLIMPSELTSANTTSMRKEADMYTLYIRCRDANGNENDRDYFIRFKVDDTPDMTAPIIMYTTLENNAYIKHNTTQVAFGIYVDEPSDCKWSKRDIDFEQMENDFVCKKEMFGQSTMFYGTYECTTLLTELKNTENRFYIRCKDKPYASEEERIVNEESYEFTLRGTNKLEIKSTAPEGTLYSRETIIKVVTEGGADLGKANCAFGVDNAGYEGMIAFLETGTAQHSQPFTELPEGDYNYNIACRDVASNEDEAAISFTIDVDEYAPELMSVYVDTFFGLTIELDEAAECEYLNVEDYKFGEGSPFTASSDGMTQEATPASEDTELFVKCMDVFNNTASYTIYL